MEFVMSVDAEEVVRKYFAARNRHDIDAVIEMLDPSYAEYDPLSPEPRRGREDFRKNEESVENAIPDFGFRISKIIGTGDLVAVEVITEGTFMNPLEFFGQAIPSTGGRIELRIAGFLRVNPKGLIAEVHEYYDSARIFQQLGIKA